MANGRHREEPARRPLLRVPRLPGLPRLPRLRRPALPFRALAAPFRGLTVPFPRLLVAAGVSVALVGVVLGVNLWPSAARGSKPAGLSDEQRYAALAADSLKDAASLRAEERAGRDRTRTSPVTTVTPSSTPTPTQTPTPAPTATGKLWVASEVNVRSGPSTSQARIGSLKALTQVPVTGVTKSGWTQVLLDAKVGWVRSSFLSETKPKPQAPSAPAGLSGAPCPKSSSIEAHLTSNARAVYRAVCAAYGSSVSSFGGYRAGDPGDHGTGRAVDIMVSGDPGWTIARFVQAHASALNVTYVIYQQQIWLAGHPTSEWKKMEDRGSITANHFDHVHVSVS